jgi:hypothetical protein
MRAAYPTLSTADKITPTASGTESDVDWVEFMVTEFSTFGFFAKTSPPAIPLPISLLSFDIFNHDCNLNLVWKTSVESDLSHFEIEKSSDGENYLYQTSVIAKGGSQVNDYSIYLPDNSNDDFYRLKMVNNDFTYQYSKTIKAVSCNESFSISIFPNPFNQDINISNISYTHVVCKLFDMHGKQVAETLVEGNQTRKWTLTELSQGVYFIKVEHNEQLIKTEKLIRQ